MNKFKIIVSSEFEENKHKIYQVVEHTLKKLVKIIDVEDFQISIESFSSDNPYWNISGAADDPHKIWVKLNIASSNFKEIINIHLSNAIAHEFHHLARKEAIKDWNLLELLVMEGLALHFVMDFFDAEKTSLTQEISDEDIQKLKEEITLDLFNENFNHKFWQNKTKRKIPHLFVYRLGYRIVKEYLEDQPGKDAVILYKEPAKNFLPATTKYNKGLLVVKEMENI